MSIGVTLDERIADGFYFARSLKLIKHLFKNPELLDKERIIGISKCDMLDDELRQAIMNELPKDLKTIMFSSVTGENIPALKDLLWTTLNK